MLPAPPTKVVIVVDVENNTEDDMVVDNGGNPKKRQSAGGNEMDKLFAAASSESGEIVTPPPPPPLPTAASANTALALWFNSKQLSPKEDDTVISTLNIQNDSVIAVMARKQTQLSSVPIGPQPQTQSQQHR